MGFRDTEWAYSAGRPLAEAAVLAALCHRTNDDTHETFVGQQTIAEMIGSSPEKVLRALKAMEQAGVITRTRRHGAGGYRTSDLIRVNVDTYVTNRLVGESPTRQIAYQENRRDLPDDSSEPTWQKVTAEEINQKDQPQDQPDLLLEAFERAWAHWPKKEAKKRALLKFRQAAKRRDVERLVADIVRFAGAYAAARDRQFVPGLATWLEGDRWDDELPAPKMPTDDEWNAFLADESAPQSKASRNAAEYRRIFGTDPVRPMTPTARAAQTLAAGRRLTRGEENLEFLARVEAEERAKGGCALAGHRWMPDGTCNFCTERQPLKLEGAA